ncbi:elongation factor P [Striga asiatica]|uniref:Elongation factor P n=1 Tax=Striga asiatica TaxID=4170 RepID=A0A5A7R1X4_STRAF|nr:elongation factor P [Striga asiatica]
MRLFVTKRISAALHSYAAAVPRHSQNISTCASRFPKFLTPAYASGGGLLDSPWFATQLRGARFSGADVRPGNVIERRGKLYEVVKADHSTQGRGGAIIQVELRDVDSGSKVNERLRTDEKVEKIYVEEKSLTYSYTDDETGNIVLMEPDTYNQLEVPRHLFDDMEITVQLYNEKPLAASIPHRVTCTVVEAGEALKGSSKSTP